MTSRSDVQEVLARYVRATDKRDGKAQGALFTADARIHLSTKQPDGSYQAMGEPLIGGAGVEWAVANLMPANPPGVSSHHVTADHLIDIDGDRAHMNAQYVMFRVRVDADGSTITPRESGYYDTHLVFVDGAWKILEHHVLADTPIAP